MNYSLVLTALLPDLLVLLSLFAALGVDYGWLRNEPTLKRSHTAAAITTTGLVLGLLATVAQIFTLSPLALGQDQLVLTPLTLAIKALLFGLAAIVCVLSAEHTPNEDHVSEYYALVLLSTLGAGFLVCTGNLLLLFVALELMSLSLYALTAFNKDSLGSAEAAIKYFTFGAVSSAFLLFGLSYYYGTLQTLNLNDAAIIVNSLPSIPPLLRVAILLIIVGIGFKIAMAPFHFWVADVYQNAPTPIAGWISSGSKIAGFFVLLKLLQPLALTPQTKLVWTGAIAFGAALSLILGNLGALRQSNLKRLLGYSSISHAGYLLTGLLGNWPESQSAVIFYVSIYAISNLGAFAVITLVSERLGTSGDITDLNGCWKRHPLLALLTGIYFLSLAGIPPLAGFIGKFNLFFSAINTQPIIDNWYQGYYWLVGFALLFSAVSLYYYLKVLKACFVTDAPAETKPLVITAKEWLCLILLAGALVAAGLFPGLFLNFIRAASA